jgi:hypothetical protein
MKKYLISTSILISYLATVTCLVVLTTILVSCEDRGTTEERLTGNENELPEELKGLKVYSVSTGYGNYVKVAIMNNQVLGTTYSKGKTSESVVMFYKNQKREIIVESIISENDSILVIKKAQK